MEGCIAADMVVVVDLDVKEEDRISANRYGLDAIAWNGNETTHLKQDRDIDKLIRDATVALLIIFMMNSTNRK